MEIHPSADYDFHPKNRNWRHFEHFNEEDSLIERRRVAVEVRGHRLEHALYKRQAAHEELATVDGPGVVVSSAAGRAPAVLGLREALLKVRALEKEAGRKHTWREWRQVMPVVLGLVLHGVGRVSTSDGRR